MFPKVLQLVVKCGLNSDLQHLWDESLFCPSPFIFGHLDSTALPGETTYHEVIGEA